MGIDCPNPILLARAICPHGNQSSATTIHRSCQGARRAALKTNNKDFEVALEWALQHSEDKDFEDPLPGYGDDDDAAAG